MVHERPSNLYQAEPIVQRKQIQERKRAKPIMIPGDDGSDDEQQCKPVTGIKHLRESDTRPSVPEATTRRKLNDGSAIEDSKPALQNDPNQPSENIHSSTSASLTKAPPTESSTPVSNTYSWQLPTTPVRPVNASLAEYRAVRSAAARGAKTASLFIPKTKPPIKVRMRFELGVLGRRASMEKGVQG